MDFRPSHLSVCLEDMFPFCRFDVTDGPRFGRLERLRGNGRWERTKRFYSRQVRSLFTFIHTFTLSGIFNAFNFDQVEKGKVRYVQDSSEDEESPRGGTVADGDAFHFRAAVEGHDNGPIAGGELHKFQISIVTLRVRAVRNVPLRMFHIREAVITDSHLMYQTFPDSLSDADLIYSLESAPSRGALLLAEAADWSLQPRRLKKGSRFSQEDLLSGNLRYRLASNGNEASAPVSDEFRFVVRGRARRGTGGRSGDDAAAMVSAVQTFSVHYLPGDDDVDVTMESLEVEEGAKKAVTEKYLNIRASDGRHFVFNVTRGPRHGQIDVLASNKMDVMRSNTSFFTSSEISEERLLYRHDDSESRRDAFHFVATSDSYSVRSPASSASDFQGRNDNFWAWQKHVSFLGLMIL